MLNERMLEMIEEIGKLPLETIDNLNELQKDLEKLNYTSYVDENTDYLIIKK